MSTTPGRWLFFVCLLIIYSTGCDSGPDSTDSIGEQRSEVALAARDNTNEKMAALEDVFEVTWSDIRIPGENYSRFITGAQAEDDLLMVASDDGILFFIDGGRGHSTSFYDFGLDPIRFPVTMGEFRGTEFVYFVAGKRIHALRNPASRKYAIEAEWVAPVPSVVATKLCNTPDALFFGCLNNHIYDLQKSKGAGLTPTRFIWRVDGNVNIPPVAREGSDRPYFADDIGNLYFYSGFIGKEHKPLLRGLGKPVVPMVLDDESGTLLYASSKFTLVALDADTGVDKKWTAPIESNALGRLYLHKGAVYVVNDENRLRAFHLSTVKDAHRAGDPLWGEKVVDEVVRVIGPSREGSLYLELTDAAIAKLDVSSGEIIFVRPLPDVDFVLSNRAAGTLYFGLEEGWLWALRER